MIFDASALQPDPYRDQLDERRAERLAELQRRVDKQSARSRAEGVRVRGLLERNHAATVTMLEGWDYTVSTFSFEHDTRDDRNLTRNDWALAFRDDQLDVVTVTNDRSRIWSLGKVRFEDWSSAIERLEDGQELIRIREQETLLVHTLDDDTDRWDLVRPVDFRKGQHLVFEWLPIAAGDDVLAVERRVSGEAIADSVRAQLSSGAGGGNPNRVFLDGTINSYVDELREQPLDTSIQPLISHPTLAYVEGGAIPSGKVWELQSIDYFARTPGDTNGPGRFKIVVAGETLVELPESDAPVSALWTGSLVLRPGDERRTYIEVANSSVCEVRFAGILRDAP